MDQLHGAPNNNRTANAPAHAKEHHGAPAVPISVQNMTNAAGGKAVGELHDDSRQSEQPISPPPEGGMKETRKETV
jgi:hypothetical protein